MKRTDVYIPAFYGLEALGTAEYDTRVEGNEINARFERNAQRSTGRRGWKGVASFARRWRSVLVADTGVGKTVMAVYIVVAFGRKACVLVHTSILLQQ